MLVALKPIGLPQLFDVADDRADGVALLRRLADVEARVAVVVGLGVGHLAALAVEGVEAVDAALGGDEVGQRVADGVDDEEAVGAVVAGHDAGDRDLVGAVDEEAVLLLVPAVEDDAARLAPVADDPQVALLAAADRHGLAVDAAAHGDLVAGLGRVDRLLDAAEVAAPFLLADGVRLERALGLGGDLPGLTWLGVGLRAGGGGEAASSSPPAAITAVRAAFIVRSLQASTSYQPVMPSSWWAKTWQW